MRTTSDPAFSHIAQDGVIAIQEAELAKLTCVRGALWVTADHNKVNLILRDGETHILKHNQLTLVCALESTEYLLQSLVAVESPSLKSMLQKGVAAVHKRFVTS